MGSCDYIPKFFSRVTWYAIKAYATFRSVNHLISSNLISFILQVFVVDSSSNDDDVDLAAAELQEALSHPSLESVPLLVFASKQDVNGARNADEVRSGLWLLCRVLARMGVQVSCGCTLLKENCFIFPTRRPFLLMATFRIMAANLYINQA